MNYYEYKYHEGNKKARVVLAYSRGKLKRIDQKAGTLNYVVLIEFVPLLEEHIDPSKILKIESTAKEDAAFFTPAQRAWIEFYESHTKLEYRFADGDGRALKKIGQHLVKVAGGVDEALDAWRYLLKNWNSLDDFYKRNVDLKFINSQLNKILNIVKNGQQTGQTGTRNHADDFRRRFHS